MHYIQISLAALVGMASVVSCGENNHRHRHRHRADQYSLVTSTTMIPTVSALPTTINTSISETGAITLIPNALTVTFSQLPAYIYLETEVETTIYETSYITSRAKITDVNAKVAIKSTSKKSTTSHKASTTSKKGLATSTTSSVGNCATVAYVSLNHHK